MPNPALNEETLRKIARDDKAGWAAPDAATGGGAGTWGAPVDDGPISPYHRATMTTGGVASATGVMLALLLVAGVFGWNAVETTPTQVDFPGWIIIALLGGFGLAIASTFKPTWARVTGPLYSVCQGLALGAISAVYEFEYDGLVVQAVGLTVLVAAAMLFAYATKLIKVTERLRSTVVVATMGIAAFYLVSLLLRLASVDMPFIWDSGPLGIGFSVLVVGIAAFNMLLDFDLADRGAKQGLPKYMEWYCAFGLMVTLVWLYLEMLRLLAKLRSR
jgi:uncharacterized YccA/Bax inhibitor family protein